MYFLYDNLLAMIVGGVVVLIALVSQQRITEVQIERTAAYVTKQQSMDFATWVEEDMLEMGLNIDPEVEAAFENPVDSSGFTTEFTFYKDTLNIVGGNVDSIRVATKYELNAMGTREVGDETIKVFQMQRSQSIDGGPWTVDGKSPGLLSYFKVDLLDPDAQPVSNPKAAALADPEAIRNTRVKFAMVTPFDTRNSSLRQVYYGSTLMIRQ